MAPEAINPPAQGFNAKVDIWSFGCVIIEMWTGKRPWGDEQSDAVLAKVDLDYQLSSFRRVDKD